MTLILAYLAGCAIASPLGALFFWCAAFKARHDQGGEGGEAWGEAKNFIHFGSDQ